MRDSESQGSTPDTDESRGRTRCLLEFDVGVSPVSGIVVAPSGDVERFTGWLDLMVLLQATTDAARATTRRDTALGNSDTQDQ
jgi:hypothetical protein